MRATMLPASLCIYIMVTGCRNGENPVLQDPPDAPLSAASFGSRQSGGEAEFVARFDASAGEFPEGIAIDKRGNIYVGLAPLGRIVKLMPDGSRFPFVTLDPAILATAPGLLGLAVDAPGTVYAALVSFNPATHGVWRIDGSGRAERLPGSEAITWPNALAFDEQGDLYVTDTALGAVWRISHGGTPELWIQHHLLEGTGVVPDIPVPLGANGIAYRHEAVFVANTEGARIVRIPVRGDGSAGEVEIIAEGPELFPLDGIALDVHGNVYAAVIGQHRIVRVTPDGSISTIAAEEDGLDFPVNLAFGTGRSGRRSIYVANFAIFPSEQPDRPGPGLVRIHVGVPGLPMP